MKLENLRTGIKVWGFQRVCFSYIDDSSVSPYKS